MKKGLLLFVCLFFMLSGFAQSRWSVNLNAGCDYNINKYYSPYNYKKFENSKEDFNLGLNVGYRLADWVRFRMEFKYNEYSYGHYFTSTSDLLKSEMTLSNLDFNPMIDFRVMSFNKFEFFLTTGLRLEYTIDDEQETLRTDGEMSTLKYIPMDYDDKMSGWTGGAILKYNLSKHLGITFTPEYTLFFDRLYSENDGQMQRFSTNVGIEWTF